MYLCSAQNGHKLKIEELDNRLRTVLAASLDKAFDFAVESRSVEQLAHVAGMAARCINWDEEEEAENNVIGFKPRGVENE